MCGHICTACGQVMLGSPLQTPEGELGVAFPPENLPKVSWPKDAAVDPVHRLAAPFWCRCGSV